MVQALKKRILAIQSTLLCFARKWWRPVAAWGLAFSVWVNAIAIPLWKKEPISLAELAALVTSFAPLMAVRAWEKHRSADTDASP